MDYSGLAFSFGIGLALSVALSRFFSLSIRYVVRALAYFSGKALKGRMRIVRLLLLKAARALRRREAFLGGIFACIFLSQYFLNGIVLYAFLAWSLLTTAIVLAALKANSFYIFGTKEISIHLLTVKMPPGVSRDRALRFWLSWLTISLTLLSVSLGRASFIERAWSNPIVLQFKDGRELEAHLILRAAAGYFILVNEPKVDFWLRPSGSDFFFTPLGVIETIRYTPYRGKSIPGVNQSSQ
ncbi:MAG: hypothetical protein P8X76_14500 [Maritimibacter sp.]